MLWLFFISQFIINQLNVIKMKAKLELSSIMSFGKKETYIFENYDEKYFPPRPKGELTSQQMFEYWSKILKEEKGINYPPSHFDMNVNFGIIFEITKV
jgi:hypothetical protein